MHDFDIAPNPVVTGKAITLTIRAETKKVLNGSDVKLDLSRSSLFGWVPLPCVFHFGSCTYHDSCTLLKRMKDENWGGMMADIITQVDSYFSMYNIDLTCPVSKQSLTISSMNVSLPHVPSYLSFLASGSYKVHVNMVDRHTKEQTFCLDLEFSIA
uniref:MD-2-related lipid-recognition domain-containing protein n=1 Tax=Octopus bimaculoides TaxID=37653 RepID=A0A0L8FMX1_OCTBM